MSTEIAKPVRYQCVTVRDRASDAGTPHHVPPHLLLLAPCFSLSKGHGLLADQSLGTERRFQTGALDPNRGQILPPQNPCSQWRQSVSC
jgi:hypothetical protein